MIDSKSIQIILARQLASCIATPVLLVDAQNALIYYNEPAEAIFNQRFDETGEMPAVGVDVALHGRRRRSQSHSAQRAADGAGARRMRSGLPDDVDARVGRRLAPSCT